MSDLYKPHAYQEIVGMVSEEVAAKLDPGKEYGVRWANQKVRRTRQVAESDGNGGRRYRKRNTVALRHREEWGAIPVPVEDTRELALAGLEAITAGSG